MVPDSTYFFYIVILIGYADSGGVNHGPDKKSVRFCLRFSGENRTVIQVLFTFKNIII